MKRWLIDTAEQLLQLGDKHTYTGARSARAGALKPAAGAGAGAGGGKDEPAAAFGLGVAVAFCTQLKRRMSRTTRTYTRKQQRCSLLCCLPLSTIIRAIADAFYGTAAALLWFAVLHCMLFAATILPAPAQEATGSDTEISASQWRRTFSMQAVIGGLICLSLGSIAMWLATRYTTQDGMRKTWLRSDLFSRCYCGYGLLSRGRNPILFAGLFGFIIPAMIGCGVRYSQVWSDPQWVGHGHVHAYEQSRWEIVVVLAVSSGLCLIVYAALQARRAAARSRAEVMAMIGSLQLDVNDKVDAQETFHGARILLNNLVGAPSAQQGAQAWSHLSDLHWGRLYSTGWYLTGQDPDRMADARADSLFNDATATRNTSSHGTGTGSSARIDTAGVGNGSAASGGELTRAVMTCGVSVLRRVVAEEGRQGKVLQRGKTAGWLLPLAGYTVLAGAAYLYLYTLV